MKTGSYTAEYALTLNVPSGDETSVFDGAPPTTVGERLVYVLSDTPTVNPDGSTTYKLKLAIDVA